MGDEFALTKEEEEVLQQKLKEGSKNAEIFQNKVKYLQETVVNMMKRKAVAEESLIRDKKVLKAKTEELEYIRKRYQETQERLEANKKKANRSRKLIKDSEDHFGVLIGDTRGLQTSSAYKCKEVESNHTVAEMAAERGYSCAKGSTPRMTNIAQMTKRGFF